LEKKLLNLSQQFTNFSQLGTLVVFGISLLVIFIHLGGQESFFTVIVSKLPEILNLVVVLYVTCVPEGLPLALGVSLSFSVFKMYQKDKILIRNLESPEAMGKIQEICCGKTGILTKGEMKV